MPARRCRCSTSTSSTTTTTTGCRSRFTADRVRELRFALYREWCRCSGCRCSGCSNSLRCQPDVLCCTTKASLTTKGRLGVRVVVKDCQVALLLRLLLVLLLLLLVLLLLVLLVRLNVDQFSLNCEWNKAGHSPFVFVVQEALLVVDVQLLVVVGAPLLPWQSRSLQTQERW